MAQILPAGRLKANVLQKIKLFVLRVIEHPLVPGVVDRVPYRAQAQGKGRVNIAKRLTYKALRRNRSLGGSHPSR